MAPTITQITAEIATLREMQPRVRHYSGFGDDHHAAIDAQVDALTEALSEADVYGKYGDEANVDFADNVFRAALDAVDWRAGDSDEVPSEGWAELV